MTQQTFKKVKITQVKSVIDRTYKQERTLRALGLRRIRHSVECTLTPSIAGMLDKVRHLVVVEEIA